MEKVVVLDERVADGVGWLVMNRPEQRNALDRQLGEALLDAFLRMGSDGSVRAIVLTGAHGSFCAGDDISSVVAMLGGEGRDAPRRGSTSDALYLRIAEAMIHAPKPVVAAIDGACAGAGTDMASAADLRLASSGARIGSALVKVGQLGNAAMLPRVVGLTKATEMFLTGQFVEADEALRIGLVNAVFPEDGFLDEVEKYVVDLAEGPTAAIGLFKELRERAWGAPVELALRLQDQYHGRCQLTEDAMEGGRAFLEKRPPRFTGH